MFESFDLDWTGGGAARFMRRRHPEVDDYPWGTVRIDDYPPWLVNAARESWSEGAYSEYCTGAGFAHLVRYMLAANIPIDLVAMAGEFVADEMLHVELNSRLAMELGGGTPRQVNFRTLIPELPHLTPFQAVNELMIRISCVGESFSVPVLTGTMRSAAHPLMACVLNRIVKDEAPHARLGWLYFEWAGELLDDAERKRLAAVATDALRALQPCWSEVPGEPMDVPGMDELGWMEPVVYGDVARRAVRERVAGPLADIGIVIPRETLAELLM